jgi:NADH dehydrogenase/NADH:ubiquinone oxidoreductase subunit G
MSEIKLQIDGVEVSVAPETTVLAAAQAAGVKIPTLCHHAALEPYGACRLCIVELVAPNGSTRLVVSCIFPVENGLVVQTRSEKIDRIRKTILELILSHAPDAFDLQELAEEYGADKNRFGKEPSFCIHCGLCVRYCNEVKKKEAIGFVNRGTHREISFIPEIAAKECWNCKECFPLCPTEALQAAYVLTKSIAFPSEA